MKPDLRDPLDSDLVQAFALADRQPTLPWPEAGDPSDDDLLRLLEGTNLAPAERQALAARVASSPWCTERLASLREALAEVPDAERPPVPEADCARSVKLVFSWARGRLSYLCGSLEPAGFAAVPVTVRGRIPVASEESTYFDFAHRFAEVDVAIQVERAPEDRLDVQLAFRGEEPTLARLRVTLEDARGALLDSQPVEDGHARFVSLGTASHRLTIASAGHEIGRIALDVHPA
jgi:hypothetical protein